MSNIRRKLKILNQGKEKGNRIKVESSDGRFVVQSAPGGLYFRCPKLADFDRMHPNNIEIVLYE